MSLLSRRLKPYYEELLEPLINLFGKYKVNPNLITLLGLLFVGIGSLLLYSGNIFLAFIFLLLGALADSVDGALARRLNLKTKFGAFLDSTVDRFSDALPFTAFGVYYASYGDKVGTLLSFLALISSFGVSYTRARAESLGVYGLGGAFERTERWIVLLGSIILGLFKIGLFIITVGSLITVLQRISETKRALEVKG
ncbi:MAG: CDP-alcohol phosphatidyltransferase family protein [Aquifex sp.]|nr:MAG: CDP-alcohol phosphatidyltransferase family protein [Aquifex sp.]